MEIREGTVLKQNEGKIKQQICEGLESEVSRFPFSTQTSA